jgi:FdhD protein
MATFVRPVEVIRVSAAGKQTVPDLVAAEEPLEIRLGFGSLAERRQQRLAVTMRTPGNDFEMVLGFLFTEGIVQSYEQIESIKYCEDVGRQDEKGNVVRVELQVDVRIALARLQRNFYTTSSCGVCGKSSIDAVRQQCMTMAFLWKIEPDIIHRLPKKLRQAQQVFEYTGGLHAAGLFDQAGQLQLVREDVGRHNALDKVIGAMLVKNSIPLLNHILFVSGRASFELVQKAAVAGIPIFAAVGAPSSLAVTLAKECGMTLLGFVREERFNIYTGIERIILP